MAKTKNKKKVSADVLSKKKSITKSKKDNPFEVHTNKEKFAILGRQLKHDKGMPGVSRSKALKRRKDTLGQEYIHKNKTNKFTDKRIGERYMTKEEAASARFVTERLNQIKNKKQSLFNLNEDDLLTHKGQTLEEIEQFQDTVSDDNDDDDEEMGKLDADFTGVAHFGGDETAAPNRKNAIDDLIAEQKRRKAEISKEKEEVSELTQALDSNWKSLLPLMGKMTKGDEVKPKPDDYDRALREMIFEPRGDVSDRLKSEEELAKKEKERLEKLERERQERMKGVTEEEKKAKHRSADDLDDGYFLQPVMEKQQELAYDVNGKNENESDDEDEAGNEHESDDNENSDDRDESDESEDEADNLSDLKDNSSEDDNEDAQESSCMEKKTKSTTMKAEKSMSSEERAKMMAKAAAELPYTFELPDTYEELESVLRKHKASYQNLIMERMIKCNHPKIVPENKAKMLTLFGFLLQYFNDIFEDATATTVEHCFQVLDQLSGYLYDLAQIHPNESAQCFREVIKEKQSDFRENALNKFPTLDTLVFLKLASVLYSSSDFRHPVITPCYVFISELLTRCKVNTRSDISRGLYLVTTVLEYAELSKRFLPAAFNFLSGVIFLAISKRPIEVYHTVPPFKSTGDQSSLLVLSAAEYSTHLYKKEQKLKSTDLVQSEIDDKFKVRLLNTALNLACNYLELVADVIGAQYFTAMFEHNLSKLDTSKYPEFISSNLVKLHEVVSRINSKPFSYIVPPERKPKTLKFLEPKFDKVYDDKRTRKPEGREKAVRNGMIRKIKSETRGAIREIRRDNAFLSKMQLKKQMQSDAERREKVKRIFSEASIQQGELNAMDRKKKHM